MDNFRHSETFDEVLDLLENTGQNAAIVENLGLVNPLFIEKLLGKVLTLSPEAIMKCFKIMGKTPSKFSLRNFFRRLG